MAILKNKSTRALILAMVALVLSSILISHFYYEGQNSANDPRIVQAREIYEHYNKVAGLNDFARVFTLLDSVELIYKQFSHYKESYEVGVLYNNRAAAFITMALHYDKVSIPSEFSSVLPDSLMKLSEINIDESIRIYNLWTHSANVLIDF